MTEPYSKRREESSEAFEAFAIYRDMGAGRSHAAVAKQLSKSETIIARWSKTHKWVARVHAYDAELDRRRRIVDMREVEKMRRRQIQTALAMQDLANIELTRFLEAAKRRDVAEGEVVDLKYVIKLLEKGTALERVNRGEPGEISQTISDDPIDLSGLTLDELKQLRSIKQKIRMRQLREAEKETEGD